MKPPPLLLGAALLFWGWQSGLLWVGAIIAIVLEGARWSLRRWEFSNDDFSRIWVFCTVLLLAAFAYAFTANKGPSDFFGWLQNPNVSRQREVGAGSARTAAAVIRWLPIIFFPFLAAQVYSAREGIPLETISLILQRRWKRAQKAGLPLPPTRTVNVTYPYFVLCLVAATAHSEQSGGFFWGFCALLVAALWVHRSRRFAPPIWVGSLLIAVALGYSAQRGIGQLQRWLESYNPQWFSRFARRTADPSRSRAALGEVGRLQSSGQIVLRLESRQGPMPTLLREASYRSYRSQVWYSETTEKDFIDVTSQLDETTWLLVAGKTNSSELNIACYLPEGQGLLPLPIGSSRLENLHASSVATNGLGAVLAHGPGLVIFNAYHGPGRTLDGPPETNRHGDLDVPSVEWPALDQVIGELGLKEQSRDQVQRTLQSYFQHRFLYTTWQNPPRSTTAETPLARFLTRTHRGHCEYFASATVLLLQRLGIPARYAVGYAVHEGSGHNYVVRLRDAHAWCLVWDEQAHTWMDFDTTPDSWIEAEAERASPLQFLSDFWSRLTFELARVRWGQTRLRQYILWALVPILAFLLYQILLRLRRRRQSLSQPGPARISWPGQDSEFYELASLLARRVAPREPGQAVSDWLARVLPEADCASMRESLARPLGLHYRYRFDPNGLSPEERESLRRESRACLQMLEQMPADPGVGSNR